MAKFQPGNKAAVGRPERKLMTQQLTSILNEQFQGMKRMGRVIKDSSGNVVLDATGKPRMEEYWAKDGKPADMTNMRKVLDNLVFNATVLNDQVAINAIFDRMEGKPAQAIIAEDENGNRLAATRFILEFDPKAPAPKHKPIITPDLPATPTEH
jgi:hypothetical protein